MISEQILRLLEIYKALSPPLVSKLKPPATIDKIIAAEKELQIEFPKDLRDLLLFTDGQDFEQGFVSPFLPGVRFADIGCQGRASYGFLIGVDEIIERTKWTREEYEDEGECPEDGFVLTGPVKYHNHFIDFTATENSDNLVLDLMPEDGGHVGQVVMMNTQPCHLAVIAPSLGSFLDLIIDGFHSGRFLPYGEEYPVWWDGGWENR